MSLIKILYTRTLNHLKKFNTYSEYYAYLQTGDIYLPRLTLIVNGGDHPAPEKGIYDDDGQKWLDFSRVGGKFIEIANGGEMFITNQPDQGLYAEIDSLNGSIVLHNQETGATGSITIGDNGNIEVTWDASKDKTYPKPSTQS